MPQASADTIQQIWITTLVIYVAVVAVVATMLALILREAQRIRGGVAAIWTVGQKAANNTIHIALLDTTNHIVRGILASASGIVAATAAIGAHAETCPGCPACVVKKGWFR